MKKIIFLLLINFGARAQQDSVITVSDTLAIKLIETYTRLYCHPDEIVFVTDGDGNKIIGQKNLSNPKYSNPDQSILRQFLLDNNITQPFTSLLDVISIYGRKIPYKPVTDE